MFDRDRTNIPVIYNSTFYFLEFFLTFMDVNRHVCEDIFQGHMKI